MNLHNHKNDFDELIAIVSNYMGIPADAVRRDYYIVQMMQNLQNSAFAENCVFKGGTSLSKCYPNSINRFSEDIDLTFIPNEAYTDKKYGKALKQVEDVITKGYITEKIDAERNSRNKSSQLLHRPEIQAFLNNTENLKRLLKLTKETDSFYLTKRNIAKDYNPLGEYDFPMWKAVFNKTIKNRYETLHEDLLYTSEKQDFDDAIAAFNTIDSIFSKIGE